MKKLIVLLAVLFMSVSANAIAYDGDFELSGTINTGFGWEYQGKASVAGLGGVFTGEGMVGTPAFAAGQITDNHDLLFYVGDVELDIAKTFGENIRLRADIDFGQGTSNSWTAVAIEQAYTTINIPVGYGVEFLVGKFNAPMGFEAVDNGDNDLPFHTAIFNRLRPQNLTGLKFYYPFSDLVDLHFWVANNLRDVAIGTDGTMPATGLRLGFTWGDEGQESTVGLSGAFSPEVQQLNNKWDDWSWFGDLDFNVWFNDVFALGGEGIFRRDGGTKVSGLDNYYYGGILNLHYVFSDVWDGTLRYSYVHDVNGGTAAGFGANAAGGSTLTALGAAGQYKTSAVTLSAMGADAQFHTADLGINYHITDGAKLMTMYRFDMILPDKAGVAKTYAAGNKTGMAHSIAANFSYDF